MKRFLSALLVALLFVSFVLPLTASAKSTVAYIYSANTDGVRLHSTPTSADPNHQIVCSLAKGTKVIMRSQVGAMYRVITENGKKGYVYSEYFDYYGAVRRDSVYTTTAKIKVYAKANAKAKKVMTIKKGQVVLLKKNKGAWAKIDTVSGKGGFVNKKKLKAVFK